MSGPLSRVNVVFVPLCLTSCVLLECLEWKCQPDDAELKLILNHAAFSGSAKVQIFEIRDTKSFYLSVLKRLKTLNIQVLV